MGCKCSKRLLRFVRPTEPPKKADGDKFQKSDEQIDIRIDSCHTPELQETEHDGDGAKDEAESKRDQENKSSDQSKSPESKGSLLERRRAEEVEFLRANDSSDADVFFLIDVRWLVQWKSFAFNFGPAPGVIDNSRLVDVTTHVPIQGLKLKEDYRGINRVLWQYWLARYGGGPSIQRYSLDLYAPAVGDEIKKQNNPIAAVMVPEVREIDKQLTAAIEAINEFPLRLAPLSQPPPVIASKGLSGIFDLSNKASEKINMADYPDESVFLNVYDLAQDDLMSTVNKITTLNDAVMIGGVFHAGVEVYGYEWAYGKTYEVCTGVFRQLPRMELCHKYRGTVHLGSTNLTKLQVWGLMQRLATEWLGSDYDLLKKNCLTFANTMAQELGVRHIPGWVDRAPRAGAAVMDTASLFSCTRRDK
jgi:hypothetical protein